MDTYTKFGQQCAERAGELLEHVSTRDTGRAGDPGLDGSRRGATCEQDKTPFAG